MEMGFPAAHICMGARPMDSQQAWFSLPTASVGPSPRSLDDDPWRLGALKRHRGEYLLWLNDAEANRLAALRRREESYRDAEAAKG